MVLARLLTDSLTFADSVLIGAPVVATPPRIAATLDFDYRVEAVVDFDFRIEREMDFDYRIERVIKFGR